MGTNNVTVVDPALIPLAPFKPNVTQNLQIAAILGLLLGVGLAFFLEYLDDTMQHPEDMERIAHLPVLGVIPMVKARRGQTTMVLGLLSHLDARSAFAEAYRSVRTALQFSTREGAPRQIVVTSTTAKEGKSTTALSLAINFAQAGQPVLLIDADLRNPSLHTLLGVDNSRGLSNYLSSDLPALGVVRVTEIPNLYLIPAGPLPPNPVELLSGPKLLGLLAELGKRFATIVSIRRRCWASPTRWCSATRSGAVLFVVAAGTHAQGAPARRAEAAAAGQRDARRRGDDQARPARRHCTATRARTTSTTGATTMLRGSPEARARCERPGRCLPLAWATLRCRSREGGNPVSSILLECQVCPRHWVPAFAGTTRGDVGAPQANPRHFLDTSQLASHRTHLFADASRMGVAR